MAHAAQQDQESNAGHTPSISEAAAADKFVWRTNENHPDSVRPRGYEVQEGTGSMTVLKAVHENYASVYRYKWGQLNPDRIGRMFSDV
eukprot:m.1655463 g.1655463  ORF g.1655463 m.1655463 type:complete len:88 (-) comp104391_c0_seq1:34-297(-)